MDFDDRDQETTELKAQERALRSQLQGTRAAGILRREWRLVLLGALCVALPAVYLALVNRAVPLSVLVWAELLEQLLGALFTIFLFQRLAKAVAIPSPALALRSVQLLAISVVMWLLTATPVLLADIVPEAALALITGVSLFTVILFWLRFFFYPFAVLFGPGSLGQRLQFAQRLRQGEPFLGVTVYLPVLGIYLVLSGIAEAFAPDDRLTTVAVASALASGFGAALMPVVLFCAALVRLSPPDAQGLKLDPYFKTRFAALCEPYSPQLARQFSFKQGCFIVAIGILLWSSNFTRQAQRSVNGELKVEQITLSDRSLRIALTVTDPEFQLRGFTPIHFRIAGERGSVVASSPARVVHRDTGEVVETRFPTSAAPVHLELEFKTSETAKDMQPLQDIYLWYLFAKVTRLDLSSATVTSSSESATIPPGDAGAL